MDKIKIFKVGGCVRDTLLNRVPKDIDYVVIGSTPHQMLENGFVQVGADFPVFLHPETNDEYALARTERKVSSGYLGFETKHDVNVTLVEDLARRDLTINSMAQDIETGEIIDPFNGLQDLKNKVLRHTTEAFAEDPLRVIRLARFAARFPDFSIDTGTIKLCKEIVNSGELNTLSNERYWTELEKVLQEEDPTLFFSALHLFEADLKVKFFQELNLQNTELTVKIVNTIKSVLKEDRLLVFVCLMGGELGNTNNRQILTAVNLLDSFNKHFSTGSDIIKFFIKARVFSEGTTFNDFMKVAKYSNMYDENMLMKIELAAEAAKKVTAAEFNGQFEGRALGEAIFNRRVNVVESIF